MPTPDLFSTLLTPVAGYSTNAVPIVAPQPGPARTTAVSPIGTPLLEPRPSQAEVAAWQAGTGLLVEAAGNRTWQYHLAKRLLDVAGAAALLVLLAPLLLTTLAALTITTRGRPFFCQRRVGLRGKLFWMFKFRTMRLDAHKLQHLVRNEHDGPIFKNRQDPRITRLGRWLRSTSIDETPQLLNVLWGDMSLVGPRPPVPGEVAQYEPWQFQRLAVKPGLTCLWQVSGRSEIGFEDWVRMDLWYIENQSLATDVRLLLATPASVLSRRGAY